MNPMEQLKDIHVPADVSWWPLAPGWWVLLAILVLSIVALIVWQVRRYRHRRALRQALAALSALRPEQDDWPVQAYQLVKQLALSYYAREEVAGLYGARWYRYLASALPGSEQTTFISTMEQLGNAQYQRSTQPVDHPSTIAQLQRWCKRAVKHPLQQAPLAGGEHV
ncbi:DUF4381 domain-containing protein [Aestuariibacter halophilus]|uniref:DUF4381 domain-containing protein n=1 Tax=Fluctibacter halophilus TaxID=226011 RepID=A0ABS8G5M9_9ALTE|nr:DUF4381 domain-containing protein [Aestuariibacter halophilus]MCC2615165.1 DUF4381 domain-containing protein [Aestuariibacter halophilus]